MRLKYEAKNAWEFERENNKLEDVMNYSKGYMHFLDVGKTERTSAREIVRMAKENGYISIDEAMNSGKVNPGDKIYAVNKDKAVALFIIGKNKLENGMKIIGGHIAIRLLFFNYQSKILRLHHNESKGMIVFCMMEQQRRL